MSMPGAIHTNISEFDNTKEIILEPAWVGSGIKLGLLKRTNMPQDELILIVMIDIIRTFAPGNSLHFNIDGEIVSFSSIDATTEFEMGKGIYNPIGLYFPSVNWSSKRYLINKQFLKKILNAQRVVIRIDLRKEYVEGIFSKDEPMSARPAFKNFYERMKGI